MRQLLLSLVLAVLASDALAGLPGHPTGPALSAVGPVPPEIRAFIARLGADDFRAREDAGKALLAMGERTLPALKAARGTVTDPEARRRVEELIRRIRTERLTTPRRVTLRGVDLPLNDVVAEIARQSGYPIQSAGTANPTLTLDLAGVPFLEAVDRVCAAAGLSVRQPTDAPGRLTLSASDTHDPHAAYAGPFRAVALTISSGRYLPLFGQRRNRPTPREAEEVRLKFLLFAEPRTTVLALGPPVVTKAVDDTGTLLLPDRQSDEARTPHAWNGLHCHDFAVSLRRDNRGSDTIRQLRCKVPVVILSEVLPEVVVEDLLRVKKKKFAGRTLDLEVITAEFDNNRLTVDLTLRRQQGDPDDSGWTTDLPQRLQVADAAGARYAFEGQTSLDAGPYAVTWRMQYTAGGRTLGKPARLSLVEFVTITRDVEFTFKDIPLP
jgi:hypothetical protein